MIVPISGVLVGGELVMNVSLDITPTDCEHTLHDSILIQVAEP
jgi:hypothetical protein